MSFNIIGKRNIFFAVSAVLILVGVLALLTRGLNLGVDFTGGSLLRVRLGRTATAAQVREALAAPSIAGLGLSETAVVQPVRGTTDVQIRAQVGGRPLTDAQAEAVRAALGEKFGGASLVELEMIEPIIGRELLSKAMIALILGWIGILIYVTLRFEYRFAVASVLALVHDVLILIGAFAILGKEVNSPFIAALLTIVGYSINDTIVVFDRIRENLKLRRRGEPLEELVNKSIVQTLTRSLNTVITTLLAVVAVYLFGGVTIRDFALAIIIGLVSGTYSSIFIASPIWLIWKNWDRAREQRLAAASR